MNDFLQPEDAPVTSKRPQLGYDFDTTSDRGMVKGFQLKGAVVDSSQIADDAIINSKIASTAISTGQIQNGAVTTTKIAGTISDKLITGGTIGTALIGTSLMVGGTVGTALIGTCTITHGTVNANMYQGNGSAGLSTAIGYLSVGTVAGTLEFNRGLLIAVT
jgi:hypothetical protein